MDNPDAEPLIHLNAVERCYPGPPEIRAVESCELRVSPGEFLAITGPSGSGKSTLLNLLGLLDRPTAGTHWFAGTEVSRATERQRSLLRAREIGFVFQAFHLLDHRTALENVMLAGFYAGTSRTVRCASAREALEAVGLADRQGQQTARMSGGERQRVAIARAMAGRPSLLLCDEPTGNLDSSNAGQVMELLEGLNQDGTTLIMITHDPAVAARSRRQVQLRDGRFVG